MKTDNKHPPAAALPDAVPEPGRAGDDAIHNLIKAAQGGDESAFDEIITRYEKLVYNLAWQYTQNSHDALDVSQEVFIKLWRSLRSFRGQSSFSTWLYRVTKNACLDYLRIRKNCAANLSLTDESGDIQNRGIPDASPEVDPASQLERAEDQRMIRRAIATLPPAHREILVLRDMRGYSYAQISEMTGLETGTVKSRISRARQKLKEILEEGNFF